MVLLPLVSSLLAHSLTLVFRFVHRDVYLDSAGLLLPTLAEGKMFLAFVRFGKDTGKPLQ